MLNTLTNSASIDEMSAKATFYLGLHCLPKYLLTWSMLNSLTHKFSNVEMTNSADTDLLYNVLPIVCCSSVFVFVSYALLCVHSSFAIILKRKRKLVALLLLSYRYIIIL